MASASLPVLTADTTDRIIAGTLAALSRLMPAYGRILAASGAAWHVRGGYITAWGRSGIDHRDSALHSRSAIGVSSLGAYHSVNTGKYTSAPLFGVEAASRVLRGLGRSP